MPSPSTLPEGYSVIHDPDGVYRVYQRQGDVWAPVPGIRAYKRRISAVEAIWRHIGYTPPWLKGEK